MADKLNDSEPKWKLYLVALAFTFSIGFSFFGIKKCVPYADTLTILSYRYVAALVGVILWIGISKMLGVYPKSEMKRPKARLYQTAAFYILFMIFQILSMFFASSIEGAIVYAMVPIFAKIIGRVVLGEKSTRLQMVFVVVTVASLIVLIVLNATDISLNFKGIVFMAIGTFFMGCQNVSARYVRGVFKPIEITAAIAIGGSVIFIGASLIKAAVTDSFDKLIEPAGHADFLIWASFLGIFCILLSAQFMAYMLAHMEIIQSTIFNSASTLVSVIAGALILGEPLCWYHYICGALILTGVVGLTLAPVDSRNAGRSLSDKMGK
ncbi:MAG: DMT family transporter [Clostridiales bacterium]|nr:DMT family transporter [Clostridiales bacterium]MDY4959091.1 DMT family transporter [Lentihominibacter sp.]